ncbi:unnamed protein product [Chrysoparadoxa australica]
MSYRYDAYTFHYNVCDGITYLCMADDEGRRKTPLAFLEDIKARALQAYGLPQLQTAIAFSLDRDFGPVLRQQMEYFNSDTAADSILSVRSKIDTVRDVMVENIEKVLERGEKIELLVDKTETLNQQAFRFERSSRSLKRNMMMRRVKVYGLVAAAAALVVVFIIARFSLGRR